jgi:hypothetical protein
MINNNVFAALIVLIASLCFINFNSFEGFMDISGTNARHAYLPQTYKNEMSIRNFKPHGLSNREEVRELETFNYNPRSVRNNIVEVEQQFKSIEGFQQKNNMNNKTNYNNHSSQQLPKHNLSETYIPQRPEYELSRGIGVSVVTPMGYRNGARPSYGVDLLRGDIFEGYTGSTPQFGSPNNPYGNLRKRGDNLNPDIRGKIKQETNQTGTEKKHGENTGNQQQQQVSTPEAYRRNNRERYVPKAIRRGYNNKAPNSEGYKPNPGVSTSRRQTFANDQQVQQFMEPPIRL